MREIKFRALASKIDGKWHYGSLLENTQHDFDSYIVEDDGTKVLIDRETAGQYTGLKDKNGKEIYEGDILLAPVYFGNLKCVCIYQQENIVSSIQGFGLYSYDSYFQSYRNLVESDEWDDFVVIGNIYDNRELLEGK